VNNPRALMSHIEAQFILGVFSEIEYGVGLGLF
jgi:hypothetical protein